MTENVNRQPEQTPPGDDMARAAEAALESPAAGDQDPTAAVLSEPAEPGKDSQGNSDMGSAGTNLNVVLDVPVQLSLELGRTRITIRDLLQLGEGSVVKLDRPPGEPLDVFVNDCLVARAEVVVVNDRFGMRITDVVSPEERLKRLR